MKKKDEIIRIFPDYMKSKWEKRFCMGKNYRKIGRAHV